MIENNGIAHHLRVVRMYEQVLETARKRPGEIDAIMDGLGEVLGKRNQACALLAECTAIAIHADVFIEMNKSFDRDVALEEFMGVVNLAIRTVLQVKAEQNEH